MRRLAAILAIVLGLTPLAAPPVSAAVAAPAENRASGSAAAPDNLIGIEARLSEDAVRENAALGYDLASDDAVGAKSLGANPFKGKTAKEVAEMLEKKGYTPRGPDPAAGRGTYVNPNTGRGYHIDASHPPPKGPHVGVHRPRDMRDTLPPRDYPLEGP